MLEFGNNVAVKVCGITNVDDAIACAAAGVEMLGLNFSPQSFRCISPEKAREIVAAGRAEFGKTKFVAVFVDKEREFVQTLVKDLALDAVQLHGGEDPDYVRNLKAPFVIKALRVDPLFVASSAADYDCDAILLDTWGTSALGGTGQTFPWSVAVAVRPLVRRLFLAGGLKPENVTDALKIVRPFAVDVCSGVEDGPGRKNHTKLRRFIEAVRAANEVTHEKPALGA
jgi:phosphoribosylanthranilate isomerase